MQIPFVGGAYLGRSTNLNAQVCQNLYPVMDQQGGKTVAALMNTPGLSLFSSPGGGEVRGLHVSMVDGLLYAVIGDTVYQITTSGAPTAMTGALATQGGKVWMADNGTTGGQLMITDGQFGYILEGTTLTQLPGYAGTLTYQDGYFVISDPLSSGSGRFYISGSYDGNAWDPLDYATAEGDPDILMAVVSARRELWLIGQRSFEVWYNSGAAAFPFERIQGSFNHVGSSAAGSVATYQGVVAWLDDNRYVVVTTGYGTQKISTPQIDYHFASYAVVSDAIGFLYSQEGHTFYVLTFPTVAKTWAYDFTTGLWHTRASTAMDNRHPANCHAFFDGKHIVGDWSNGNLYQYDLGIYSDNGEIVRRVRTAQPIHAERKRMFHHSLEIDFEPGVGIFGVGLPSLPLVDESGNPILDESGNPLYSEEVPYPQGSDPKCLLDWSDDGGHTWSNQRQTAIGKLGEYTRRARFHRLGSCRDRIYRLTITDAVKTVIIGAHLEAEAGVS